MTPKLTDTVSLIEALKARLEFGEIDGAYAIFHALIELNKNNADQIAPKDEKKEC